MKRKLVLLHFSHSPESDSLGLYLRSHLKDEKKHRCDLRESEQLPY